MCGIIAVVRRPGARQAPSSGEVVGPLHDAVAELAADGPLAKLCTAAAELVEETDGRLRGAEGVWALVHDRRLLAEVEGVCASLSATLAAIEARLGPEGRVLIRPSGTEPMVRVMVEAPTEAAAEAAVSELVAAVEQDRPGPARS